MKEVEIIVRFPNEEIADKFIGQMMDGFGEGMCDFTGGIYVECKVVLKNIKADAEE